jgi:hypothetical protein
MKTEKQKLTSLTRKYFWKQKLIEFSWLMIIFLITIGYYKIIDYLNCKYPTLFYSAGDESYIIEQLSLKQQLKGGNFK